MNLMKFFPLKNVKCSFTKTKTKKTDLKCFSYNVEDRCFQ